MLTLISVISLLIMVSSLFFAIASKQINLPHWYEIIAWIFILASIGLLLNNLFEPPYVKSDDAEVVLRFFGSILVAGGVIYAYRKNGGKQ